MTSSSLLDADEYLHLALHASGRGDHHAALQYLKSVLLTDPDHVLANYMLAAEHAELGLYKRAREGFIRVIELQPDMETARFQLGLLHSQLDETTAARASFAWLTEFATDEALRAFAGGLMQLGDGNRDQARVLLLTGIEHCGNEPLKADMQRIVAKIDNNLLQLAPSAPEPAGTIPAVPPEGAPVGQRKPVFLGAYRNAGNDSAS